MFLKDIPADRLALLTPEQLKVVERWDREAKARQPIIAKLCAAWESGDQESTKTLGRDLVNVAADVCEHGRHKHSVHCFGCEEIEHILFPDLGDGDDYDL